jgi:cytoskeletal protein RodZ
MFKDLKKMPDEKKKTFSVIIAVIVTLILAVGWFFVKSKISYFNEKNPEEERAVDDLKQSFYQVSDKFKEAKNQYFGTSTGTSTDLNQATGTASSSDAIEATSSTSTI